jgi:hypothetical protein
MRRGNWPKLWARAAQRSKVIDLDRSKVENIVSSYHSGGVTINDIRKLAKHDDEDYIAALSIIKKENAKKPNRG